MDELAAVEEAMLYEVRCWTGLDVDRVVAAAEAQVLAGGKRLRPRLGFALAEASATPPGRLVAPLAAVELYHLASLVLDDVQDNAQLRHGTAAVHTTAGTSTAINVAAFLRSTSYHAIHRSAVLTDGEKLSMRRELDDAATRLVLGQSLDIGWNDSWFDGGGFPYERMVSWKTGSLFGCAAAMAARAAGLSEDEVTGARDLGVGFGALYQLVDDYRDAFTAVPPATRPALADLRAGKMSAPVVGLLAALRSRGCGADADEVVRRLGDAAAHDRILALMSEVGVRDGLRSDIQQRAAWLGRAGGMGPLVAAILAMVDGPVR